MIDYLNSDQGQIWYLIGLIATDGCLSSDGRHITLTSKDEQILVDIKRAFNLMGKAGKKSSGHNTDKIYSCLHIGDVRFYRYLLTIGLTPAKSISLGEILTPDKYFPDFLRGVIEGDGCIYTWTHPTNMHSQSSLRIASAAPKFTNWLFKKVRDYWNVPGQIVLYPESFRKNQLYQIKFGKMAAEIILKSCYYEGCLANARKVVQVQKLSNQSEGLRKYTPGWRNW